MCRVYPKLKTKTKLKIKIKTKITNTKTFTWLGRLRPTPGFVDNTWLSKNTNVHQPPMHGFLTTPMLTNHQHSLRMFVK
jgi:hypothetical protein